MKFTQNGVENYTLAGHYFEINAVANPVRVRLSKDGNAVGDFRDVGAGFVVDRRGLVGFDHVEITTGAAEEVDFFVSDGTAGNKSVPFNLTDDATRELGLVAVKGNPTTFEDGVQITADAQILAANANRRKATLQVSPSGGDLYVTTDGSAAVATFESFLIEAGSTWETDTTGEIRGIASSGTVDVHVIEQGG